MTYPSFSWIWPIAAFPSWPIPSSTATSIWSGEAEGKLARCRSDLSPHAAIRAHVAAAALPAKRPEQREESIAEAGAYLDLAQTLLRPAKPRLVAIGGFSGTGKSTLAYGLAPGLGAPLGARVLAQRRAAQAPMGVAPESPLPAEAYGEAVTRSVYGRLGEEAGRLLRAGCSVILDALFLRPEQRAAAEALARDLHVDFQGFWLEAAPEILAARIEGRRGDASDATREILRRQLAFPTGPVAWHRVDVGWRRWRRSWR